MIRQSSIWTAVTASALLIVGAFVALSDLVAVRLVRWILGLA